MTPPAPRTAAEQLRHALEPAKDHIWLMEQALAAERRATVERIRERLNDLWLNEFDEIELTRVLAILDEEATR